MTISQSTSHISNPVTDFTRERCEQANFSCKSYIVTIFGDVLTQHNDWLWLGSLIEALEPLGYSERLIRTSVFRLVQEDWLQTKKVGRRSFYAFTDSAKRHYEKAARRIYADKQEQWHGHWLIVLPTFVPEHALTNFKKQLNWLGFSSISSGVFAHPSLNKSSLEDTLTELNLTDSVVVFQSKTIDDSSANVLKNLVEKRWKLAELGEQYQQFINRYQAFNSPEVLKEITDKQSFVLRTLLIHEYRRILLKDHELPEQMLPKKWQGFLAHQLVKSLYLALAKSSLKYINQALESSHGHLPAEQASFWQRFSGSNNSIEIIAKK